MIKNGGYTMLDFATATYKDVAAAFNANKPILVYDNSQVYYADTCVYDSDNDAYVITKGGKTITIDSSNNVVSSGLVNAPTMENIKDLSGNLRFVEGGISVELSGLNITYGKWSLSGTHLMLVLAGSIDNGVTISASDVIFDLELPTYIMDKIYAVWGENLESKTFTIYAADWSSTQTLTAVLQKKTGGFIRLLNGQNLTTTNIRNFRIAFD